MERQGKRVLFSGYAKVPTGITASELYKVIGVVAVIDADSGEIVEADCTMATSLARRFVADALTGQSIQYGPEKAIAIIDQVYHGSAKKAIITALRIIYDKYRSYSEGTTATILE